MMPTVALGDVTDVLSGFAFKSNEFGDEGELPVVRIRNVVGGRSDTFYAGEYSEKFIVNNGDVLIGMDGEFNRERWSGGRALLNQRVCRIQPVGDALDDGYLYHFLPAALKAIERDTPFATVKHLSAKRIRAIDIPLPPIQEQRRIAAILDAVDALRTKRLQAIEELGTLTQSIFIDMFGTPHQNVHGFAEHALGDLCEVKGGKRLPKGSEYAAEPTASPYIRATDFRRGEIETDDLRYLTPEVQTKIARYTVACGDVVISIAGSIGQIASVPDSLDGANLTENAAKLVRKDDDVVATEYLASFLRSDFAQHQIASRTGRVTIGKLALFRIAALKVLVPPIPIQRRFESALVPVRQTRALLGNSADSLDVLFASLQQRAFRGGL